MAKVKLKKPEQKETPKKEDVSKTVSLSEQDPDIREKSSAIIKYAKPILNEALRKKNPEVFDKWEGKRKELLSEMIGHLKAGRTKEYEQSKKAVEEYQDKTPMELYLNKQEIQSALGEHYQPYQEAMKYSNKMYAQRSVVGQKEMPSVKQMEDVLYGKRMMTQPSLSSGGGEYYYDYDPAKGSFEKKAYKK